jgi:hypothetical protein
VKGDLRARGLTFSVEADADQVRIWLTDESGEQIANLTGCLDHLDDEAAPAVQPPRLADLPGEPFTEDEIPWPGSRRAG